MAGSSSLNDDDFEPISAINVTPFVDVVLVLLVIFMVTAPMIFKDVLQIQLPKAAVQSTQTSTSFGVVVTKDGQILINGQAVDEQGLQAEVRKVLSTNAQVQALISADTDSKHGDLVRAIEWVQSAGVRSFAIQIERK
jgi:biopolymer transport protein ExbD